MSVKIISSNDKSIKLEITIDFNNDNFMETEELIMNKVNELGRKATQKAMENLDIKEQVIEIEEQRLYAKKKLKDINPHMEKSK